MKALILAGGRGKRLDEMSAARNKCVIPIHGRPAIEYPLENALAAGVDEIVIVVGYRAEEIINLLGSSYRGRKISYVIQWEQRGLVHAMECAREALGPAEFMLLLGDEIMLNPRHAGMVQEFRSSGVFALCGVLPVQNRELIKRTYTIIEGAGRQIFRLVEKPRTPLNEWMGTGVCIFNPGIFEYFAVTPIHHQRQEKELPDLIQCAIDDGKVVRAFQIAERYTNLNTREDVEMAESFFA